MPVSANRPYKGVLNHDPYDRSKARTTVTADLARHGWRPPSTMPEKKPIALIQREQMPGEFDGSGAFILEDGYLFLVDPRAPYTAYSNDIVGWKPWERATFGPTARPSRGRKG